MVACTGAECPSDVIFALDSSSSLPATAFPLQLGFVHGMVEGLRVGEDYSRVGLVSYSAESHVHFHLRAHPSSGHVLAALHHVTLAETRAERDLARVLRRVRTQMFSAAAGDRSYDLNILILITAGLSPRTKTLQEAKLVKEAGIHIITVGVGLMEHTQDLDLIASEPADINRYLVIDFQELNIIIPKLITHICRGTLSAFM